MLFRLLKFRRLSGDYCPEDYFTLVMRRIMMKISEEIAKARIVWHLLQEKALGRLQARRFTHLAVRTMQQICLFSAPASEWIRKKSLKFHEILIPLETSIQPYEGLLHGIYTKASQNKTKGSGMLLMLKTKFRILDEMMKKQQKPQKRVFIK